MQQNTLIVTNNNVAPISQIIVVEVDTTVEPSTDTQTEIDYDSLSASEKTQFDDCVTMILSKIPV